MDWTDKVATDYRSRIIVDPDSPILAFKTNRDRYTRGTQLSYAGLPYLGSQDSEDALTWNVFRSLQKSQVLPIITANLNIGEPLGLLLWALAPDVDGMNAKLQYTVGMLIRRFDGILPGQMTEPDVVILGTKGIAVIECKLSEPEKPPSHLWEGSVNSVKKRLPVYLAAEPTLLRKDITDAEIAEIYQLVRMAFYALQLGKSFSCTPVVVSIGNERNWFLRIPRLHKSAAELWDLFRHTVATSNLNMEDMRWQHIRSWIPASLNELSHYLSDHPCL